MLEGNAAGFLAATEDVAPKGKTSDEKRINSETAKEKNLQLSEDAELRNRAAMVAENIDIIKYFGGKNATLEYSFSLMDKPDNVDARDAVKEEFGIDYELVKHLILSGKINRHLIDLKFRK